MNNVQVGFHLRIVRSRVMLPPLPGKPSVMPLRSVQAGVSTASRSACRFRLSRPRPPRPPLPPDPAAPPSAVTVVTRRPARVNPEGRAAFFLPPLHSPAEVSARPAAASREPARAERRRRSLHLRRPRRWTRPRHFVPLPPSPPGEGLFGSTPSTHALPDEPALSASLPLQTGLLAARSAAVVKIRDRSCSHR